MKIASASCLLLVMMLAGSARADVADGKSTYAARGCIGCHGAGGVSVVATYPSLKGRNREFIRQSLTAFRSGERKSPVMNAMAAGLNDADIANLADYIGSLD
jgi:cytochrome c553